MSLVDRFIHKYSRLPTERDPDYLEMLRMSKYRILDIPDFKPGKCANCGSAKKGDRKYVDFGLEVDWFGIVYLCTFCLHDIAENAGLFEKLYHVISILKRDLVEANAQRFQGEDLHARVMQLSEELKEYYANLYPLRNEPTSDSNPSMEPESGEPSESSTDSSKSGDVKQTDVTGRKNVPNFTDLLNQP